MGELSKKEQFEMEFENSTRIFGKVTKMVIAVKLPTGATELITNTEEIESKYSYYLSAYDEDMKLKNNNQIEIVGCLFV